MFDRWTRFALLSRAAGFLLAMPSAIGGIWADGRFAGAGSGTIDDVGYLLAVVEDVRRRGPVDPRRIYVVGMSNGATMAGRLACEHSDRFAAIAQVAGTVGSDVAARCRPAGALPVLSIHGTADRYAPYAGGRARGPFARLVLRRPADGSLGVEAWARLWVAVNGATGPEVSRLGADTSIRRWHGPTPASDVVFYRLEGGGHTWPGNPGWVAPFLGRTSRTFDATRHIWAFLSSHRREA